MKFSEIKNILSLSFFNTFSGHLVWNHVNLRHTFEPAIFRLEIWGRRWKPRAARCPSCRTDWAWFSEERQWILSMYHTITFSISETLYILFKPLNQTLPNSQLLNNKSRFAKCFHKIFSFNTNTRPDTSCWCCFQK